MRTFFIIAMFVVSAPLLSGCGDDEASGVQGEAAEQTIADLKAEGIGVDEGCVHDAAKELTDADATAILNNGELSEAGEELGLRMFLECVDLDDIE